MAFHSAATIGQRRSQHDELRQVIVQRAKAVMRPGADRGKVAINAVAARMELKLCAMIAVFGPHRADNGEVIGAIADVRPPVADFDPALAALAVADLQW